MDTLPRGERQEVITYRVTDFLGAVRTSGVTEDKARTMMAHLVETAPAAGPFSLERTTYVSFTHREVIEHAAVD